MTQHRNTEPTWISARSVKLRYGGDMPISNMTLHRWLNNPAMNFPRPTYFGRFRFWRLDELEAWERSQPRGRTLAEAETEAAA